MMSHKMRSVAPQMFLGPKWLPVEDSAQTKTRVMAGKSQRLPSRNDRSAADRVIELLQVSEDDAKEWEAERKK